MLRILEIIKSVLKVATLLPFAVGALIATFYKIRNFICGKSNKLVSKNNRNTKAR